MRNCRTCFSAVISASSSAMVVHAPLAESLAEQAEWDAVAMTACTGSVYRGMLKFPLNRSKRAFIIRGSSVVLMAFLACIPCGETTGLLLREAWEQSEWYSWCPYSWIHGEWRTAKDRFVIVVWRRGDM